MRGRRRGVSRSWPRSCGPNNDLPRERAMDLDFSPEDLAFQAEARTFLAENYPKALRDKQARGEEYDKGDYLAWHRVLAKQGWIAPSWPKEHGGTEWTP